MTWPTPEVPARIAAETEIPTGARRMASAAHAAGWLVVPTYARGTRPGRPPRVVDSLALRMWHGHRRAVATWEDGKFAHAQTWSDAQPMQKYGAKALRAFLEAA